MHPDTYPETTTQAHPRRSTPAVALPVLFVAMALTMLMPAGALAHGVDFRIQHGDAVMVFFSSDHEGPMVGAGFRVFTPDDSRVFARGRTDALGRAVFAPDRPGNWRMLMATEDGHGAEVDVVVEEHMTEAGVRRSPDAPAAGRIPATAAGVGYLFGLAGLLALWRHRR